MKSSTITTFRLFVVSLIFVVSYSHAFKLSGTIGIYDFTDEVSKDFYRLAASGKISLEFLEQAGFSLGFVTGASFISVPYNGDDHDFLMVPIILAGTYTYIPETKRFMPFWAVGIGVYAKMDHNDWFPKNHYAATYGYNFSSGIIMPLKKKQTLFLIADISLHLLISPSFEDLNTSGVQSTFGIMYTPKRKDP
jgi:hypothetical protein